VFSNVFEPFFSSKADRSGLGLSIVYSIVKLHGGGVRVSSEPEEGTTVKVFLPRAEGDEPEPESDEAWLRGTETVLVVEDEDGVRELLWKVLTGYGHTVLEARHGKDALAVAAAYGKPIDLMVSDVVMPEMSASEMVERLLAARPDLKVLFISGYTNDEIVRRGVGGGDAAFIHKPFTSQDLMRKVREVLDGKA
jgi:CheY-like chemotaxis protein